ncbi:MAG: hypothetical protein SF029_19945 [bacterium]|nr:hypothetical protein [bacterium]
MNHSVNSSTDSPKSSSGIRLAKGLLVNRQWLKPTGFREAKPIYGTPTEAAEKHNNRFSSAPLVRLVVRQPDALASGGNSIWRDPWPQPQAVLFLVLSVLAVVLSACAGSDTAPQAVSVPTRVDLPTETPSNTPDIPTATATSSATSSHTPTPTDTTATPTLTVTPSQTITNTPTRTATNTPTLTATPEPTIAESGVGLLLTLAAQFTPLPTEFQVAVPTYNLATGTPSSIGSPGTPIPGAPVAPTPVAGGQCQYLPAGGFGQLYLNDPALAGQLGCAIGAPPVAASLLSANQSFERGTMVYVNNPPGYIYVLRADGTFQRFDDTFNPAVDPESTGLTPPAGLQEPVRGIGKVWRTNETVRSGLGWASGGEQGTTATVQDFANGRMLYLPVRGDIVVLVYAAGSPASGTWRAVPGAF